MTGAEVARQYGLSDEGGRQPPSYRDTQGVAPRRNYANVIIR